VSALCAQRVAARERRAATDASKLAQLSAAGAPTFAAPQAVQHNLPPIVLTRPVAPLGWRSAAKRKSLARGMSARPHAQRKRHTRSNE